MRHIGRAPFHFIFSRWLILREGSGQKKRREKNRKEKTQKRKKSRKGKKKNRKERRRKKRMEKNEGGAKNINQEDAESMTMHDFTYGM